MYEDFFGLSEKPFALTPNPRFVFQSEQYRVAEEQLLYGIHAVMILLTFTVGVLLVPSLIC